MKKISFIATSILILGFAFLSSTSTNTETPNISPIQKKNLTRAGSGYGMRMHPIYKIKKLHTGMDFIANSGTNVLATADGKVVLVEKSITGRGNNITIKHANNIKTSYCHLNEIKVTIGQQVSQKDIIGTVGNTGASTGFHLHYEVEQDGAKVNPAKFIIY
tara:strand:- start:22818 stop:23300 length:483 start_codon:yes stop_codon:yes gene_type:complete